LAAAATRQRHIGEADVREIAKAGAKAGILQGIEADQKAEAARLLSLAKAKGFDTWEAAREPIGSNGRRHSKPRRRKPRVGSTT
jgi:hypothetical protein